MSNFKIYEIEQSHWIGAFAGIVIANVAIRIWKKHQADKTLRTISENEALVMNELKK